MDDHRACRLYGLVGVDRRPGLVHALVLVVDHCAREVEGAVLAREKSAVELAARLVLGRPLESTPSRVTVQFASLPCWTVCDSADLHSDITPYSSSLLTLPEEPVP